MAIKLNTILSKYSEKLRRDQIATLKLSDIVTIKNMLRDKLYREAMGFRTSNTSYKDLEKVNPDDIVKIIDQIKLKLGH